MSGRLSRRVFCVFAALVFFFAPVFCVSSRAGGERADPLPGQIEGVGVTERLNSQLPLDAEFKDENGRPVKLRDYIAGDKPFVLTLNYFHCPMLCTLILNGLADGVKQTPWTPGKEFQIITVSINPLETPALAKLKKEQLVSLLDKPESGAGWHFLTGNKESIDALTNAAGFHYRYDKHNDQYYHIAAIMAGTPQGRVSRYLYGVKYDPQTLRLSLSEASEGKAVSTKDRILLYCFHYDAVTGRYAPAALNIMRLGGALTLLALTVFLSTLWLRDKARKQNIEGNANS